MQRERPESGEWRDTRREEHPMIERQSDVRREPIHREERIERNERNERPQRPDSRDSRTSRESRTSLRDEDTLKLRDIGSWAQDIPDYEEKKRDSYRDDHRERDRDGRWQLPGPVTREKLVTEELKSEKRGMTPLKRGSIDQQEKKESPTETKKEADVWNKKLERTPDNNRTIERSEISPKIWSESVSPTFEKEEAKLLEPAKDDKDIDDMKESMNKLCVDERESSHEEIKDDSKDDKREKNVRNRTNSGGSRTRETRGGTGGGSGGRTWQAYNVYRGSWRGPEPRGRRAPGPRSMGRPGSAKSGSYGHSEMELSGDEISGSAESGKEERREREGERRSAVSPKPLTQKIDKEDRNREVSRREDKRTSDYSQARSEKRGYDGKPSREGFAPSGEPSRRGRGGFRTRGATTGYGPPPSKSPFSTERCPDEKQQQQQQSGGQQQLQNPSTPTPQDNDLSAASSNLESTDDKMIAKQQALTAGITGRRNKSPNLPSHQGNKQEIVNHGGMMGHNVGLQRNQLKKDDSRSKRNRSGSRRVSKKLYITIVRRELNIFLRMIDTKEFLFFFCRVETLEKPVFAAPAVL